MLLVLVRHNPYLLKSIVDRSYLPLEQISTRTRHRTKGKVAGRSVEEELKRGLCLVETLSSVKTYYNIDLFAYNINCMAA